MNQLDSGPTPRPITIIYVTDKDPKQMQTIPAMAFDVEDARKTLQLLIPGAKLLGMHNGHESGPDFQPVQR